MIYFKHKIYKKMVYLAFESYKFIFAGGISFCNHGYDVDPLCKPLQCYNIECFKPEKKENVVLTYEPSEKK